FEELTFSPDRRHIHIESFCYSLFRNAALNGFQNHTVFLDHRDAVHPLVVCVGLIIRRHQARDLDLSQILEHINAQMTVEEKVLSRIVRVAGNYWGLDDPYLSN